MGPTNWFLDADVGAHRDASAEFAHFRLCGLSLPLSCLIRWRCADQRASLTLCHFGLGLRRECGLSVNSRTKAADLLKSEGLRYPGL